MDDGLEIDMKAEFQSFSIWTSRNEFDLSLRLSAQFMPSGCGRCSLHLGTNDLPMFVGNLLPPPDMLVPCFLSDPSGPTGDS